MTAALHVSNGDATDVPGTGLAERVLYWRDTLHEGPVPAVDAGSSLLTADGRQVPAPAAQPLDELKDQIRAEARRLGKSAD